VTKNFLPVRLHIKEQPTAFGRFRVNWTPTLLVVSPDGVERHRIEGFLPAEELVAQLELGLGHWARQTDKWAEAEQRYRKVVENFPKTAAAPEALYWAGVAKYKVTGARSVLDETARQMKAQYPESEWMKKASVWGD
jgi:hypothetical protein